VVGADAHLGTERQRKTPLVFGIADIGMYDMELIANISLISFFGAIAFVLTVGLTANRE
jgi:hypothetical protein